MMFRKKVPTIKKPDKCHLNSKDRRVFARKIPPYSFSKFFVLQLKPSFIVRSLRKRDVCTISTNNSAAALTLGAGQGKETFAGMTRQIVFGHENTKTQKNHLKCYYAHYKLK